MRETLVNESIERAQEGIEHAHHAHVAGDQSARRIAILISVLAAMLALAEMGEKSAQNDYITNHVALSDAWAFYQAKTVRWNVLLGEADTLDSLPNASDPAVRERAAHARADAARLNDDEKTRGRKQLEAEALRQSEVRDHALHHYHDYEWVVGALQIAIVLASVSVVTRVAAMWIGAAVLGGAAALFALVVVSGLI
jgi:hypothetical protein